VNDGGQIEVESQLKAEAEKKKEWDESKERIKYFRETIKKKELELEYLILLMKKAEGDRKCGARKIKGGTCYSLGKQANNGFCGMHQKCSESEEFLGVLRALGVERVIELENVSKEKMKSLEEEKEKEMEFLTLKMKNEQGEEKSRKEKFEKEKKATLAKKGIREELLFSKLAQAKIVFTHRGELSLTGNQCLRVLDNIDLILESLEGFEEKRTKYLELFSRFSRVVQILYQIEPFSLVKPSPIERWLTEHDFEGEEEDHSDDELIEIIEKEEEHEEHEEKREKDHTQEQKQEQQKEGKETEKGVEEKKNHRYRQDKEEEEKEEKKDKGDSQDKEEKEGRRKERIQIPTRKQLRDRLQPKQSQKQRIFEEWKDQSGLKRKFDSENEENEENEAESMKGEQEQETEEEGYSKEVNQAIKEIKDFHAHYLSNFPGNPLPKQHLLEAHATKFLRRWLSLGMMSEQGVEGVHALFNRSRVKFKSFGKEGSREKAVEYHNSKYDCEDRFKRKRRKTF